MVNTKFETNVASMPCAKYRTISVTPQTRAYMETNMSFRGVRIYQPSFVNFSFNQEQNLQSILNRRLSPAVTKSTIMAPITPKTIENSNPLTVTTT